MRRSPQVSALFAAVALAALFTESAFAQFAKNETRANSYTTGNQQFPSLAAIGPGSDFVVVWDSYLQDDSEAAVVGRKVSRYSEPIGAEFQVNSYTTAGQYQQQVASRSDGSFIVVWRSQSGQDGDSSGIYAQRYSSAAVPAGPEFRVNSHTTSIQRHPSVAAMDSGEFAVVWQSYQQDGDGFGVYAQMYDGDGATVGTEFLVNSYTTGWQSEPQVATDNDGRFLVVWSSDFEDGSGPGIYAIGLSSTGAALDSEFLVNTEMTLGQQLTPAVAALGSNDFVVTWESDNIGQTATYIPVRRFNAQGDALGDGVQANSYTTGTHRYAKVAAAPDGTVTVVWATDGQDGAGWGVFGQMFDAELAPIGPERRFNSTVANDQTNPNVAANAAGDFVVAWMSVGQDGDGAAIYTRPFGWLFLDGFESNDTCGWSFSTGGC